MTNHDSTLVEWQSVCQECGERRLLEDVMHRCKKCKGALAFETNYEQMGRLINYADWKYSSMRSGKYWSTLPLKNFMDVVSLQEGATPLRRFSMLAERVGLPGLWAKLENYNPTGVFKDRGSLLELSWAVQHGVKKVVCASTGNMAGSVSAYAARAGIECFIFVPEGVPVGKLSQIMAYGAKVIAVRGDYNDCVNLTEYLAEKYGYFLVGDYALRAEGQKTIAYEIVEQLHWQVPDWVVVPMGNGTNISGIYKGFRDLQALGFIERLPRLVGVQADNVSPIKLAWENGTDEVRPVNSGSTLAGAVNVAMPLDASKALKAIRETHGKAIAVFEDRIIDAQRELSIHESVFVEPAASLSWAAVKQLQDDSSIRSSDTVVMVLTGHGLKDPRSVLTQVLEPAVINPTRQALDEMWQEKLYDLGKVRGVEADAVVWKKDSVPEDLRSFVSDRFGVHLEPAHLEQLRRVIDDFHEKVDIMRLRSLNLLLEDVTKLPSDYREVLRVLDFHINVFHHGQPQARATVKLNGDKYTAETYGVGPVDAVILGIDEALEKSNYNIKHELVDYDVEIDKGGTDATVRVHLVIEDDSGNKITGTAVSPDVITASIVAFERAYNLLYQKII